MKDIARRLLRTLTAAATAAAVLTGTSCMTTYDAYGQPRPSVDPGLAVAGLAAAGAIGYAIGQNNDHRHGHGHSHYYYGGGGYYRPRY